MIRLVAQTSHAKAGVEKGLASKTGLPIEIMGLMTGEIDTENENTLIVTDVAPIPVEGTETSVILDNTDLHNYMIAQSELFDEVLGIYAQFSYLFSLACDFDA